MYKSSVALVWHYWLLQLFIQAKSETGQAGYSFRAGEHLQLSQSMPLIALKQLQHTNSLYQLIFLIFIFILFLIFFRLVIIFFSCWIQTHVGMMLPTTI